MYVNAEVGTTRKVCENKSYQVELLKNGEQVDCPIVFVSFSLRVLITQIVATAVIGSNVER